VIKTWFQIISCLVFVWVLGFTLPVFAASERAPLSIELFQQRLTHPVLTEGVSTIDLTNFIIDLSNQNPDFRDQFYQQLQNQLTRSPQPLGIDLSDSLLQGDFLANTLALSTPLTKVALPPLLTSLEQEKLEQDDRFVSENGEQISTVNIFRGSLTFQRTQFMGKVDFSKTFFLQRLEAKEAFFADEANWIGASFGRITDFSEAIFAREVNFSRSQFFGLTRFYHTQFRGVVKFTGSRFEEEGNFLQAQFTQLADLSRTQWWKDANFNQVNWHDRLIFSKSIFFQSLSLVNSTLEKSAAFRSTHFQGIINFKDLKILNQLDFSNGIFLANSMINVAGLAFDSEQAKILGDTGVIGKVIYLSKLAGNETLIRNLVQNFRRLEQIPDANQVEYKAKKLQLQQIRADFVRTARSEFGKFCWLAIGLNWLLLALLLLLSHYGTNFSLVLGVGIISFAYFGCLFWFIDRVRRRFPNPIIPHQYDIICMSFSGIVLIIVGLINIFQSTVQPWITLICLGLILLPLTIGLSWRLYRQGRYHDLMDSSYFLLEGGLRDLRLLIVRLPVIPEFPFYRDRYTPLPWNRRWNWLNYYDFSLNNLIKLGFNDIRLRDQHLPGIISILVWYQWGLGLLYVALLLWTLSRTIPGLNLLIYLK
jgi:hypothetical protein